MRHRLRVFALVAASCLLLTPAFGAVVKAYESSVTLPTYPWQPDVPHPYFSETDGRTIYPYTMQDNIHPDRAPRMYPTVVLESDLIKLTFIPELGGRIWEAIDKVTDKPIFYVNHVVRPGLIAMRGAWISGGVEFNSGPQGHTVSAISPVDVLILPETDGGSRSVAVGEIDRIHRLQWTVIVTLRPGRRFIEEQVTIYNRMETVCPYYFWNCTAQPNTQGFRFVYPMTLGMDHSGKTFFRWPIDKDVDLSWGKNYRRMSSIFGYQCDQDFFGSYDVDEDRGCVAFADHNQLPGKKAWTWGWGGDGIAHQRMLTDDDGPYNEVQTGPLHTQAETGRLDPHEAVSWKEWWSPVHALGGEFTYANRDVCARAVIEDGQLDLRILGTGSWTGSTITVSRDGETIDAWRTDIAPQQPVQRNAKVGAPPVSVEVSQKDRVLASFTVPLPLPKREPPEDPPADPSPEAVARDGWTSLLLARRNRAIDAFKEALGKDEGCVAALLGLVHCSLAGGDAAEGERLASRAVEKDPRDGRARLMLAVSLLRLGKEDDALREAWQAALDPATVTPGRAIAGKILIRRNRLEEAVDALGGNGPWAGDPVVRDRLAIALLELGRRKAAATVSLGTVTENPLDTVAWYVLARLKSPGSNRVLEQLLGRDAECELELAFALSELDLKEQALAVLEKAGLQRSPMAWYTASYLRAKAGLPPLRSKPGVMDGVFPSRLEEIPVLEYAVQSRPDDATARLLLGHLRFHLGQTDAARKLWEDSARINPSSSVASRALGVTAWKLDGDLAQAERYLRQALSADPRDGIVGRDLALVLQAAAAKDVEQEKPLFMKSKEVLETVLPHNKHRADVVEMLARLYNRLGELDKAAELLDGIYVTAWEGAQGLHDMYRAAHLGLGKRHFEAARFEEAAGEFRRALEYPENLGIGRREGAEEADLYHWLGMALSRAGENDNARAAWKRAAEESPSRNAEIERCRKLAQDALNEPQ